MVTLDIPLSRKISQKINDENLLKLAEKSYNDGYLENSAIYYRDYLETNPKKLSKIKVYEKMFEIGVVRNNFE
ncbi:MAG TPA: hypothetical protein PLO89_03545 [Spirochaetota bacterium]|nr:hypothetical protein [Spirochaetota bacterium]